MIKKCYYLAYKSVSDQMNSIVEGFKTVIPLEWVRIFTPEELEIAICGVPTLDLTDWKTHTQYKGYKETSKAVLNFWKAMETYN